MDIRSDGVAGTGKYAVPFYLALIAAGLAGNYFNFTILNADFIFGSIFAMLALQFFGVGRGILAAGIISGYTYLAWNHPFAVITMTAEAAVVGFLINRTKINLLLADALYWLFIGIPLGYFCFYFIADLPASNSIFLMTKQAINGIANALVARLIFTGYTLRSRLSLISYREILSNLLAFFVLASTLIMLTVGSRTDLAETDRHIRAMLLQDSRRLEDRLETWVVNRKSAILHLAEMAASRSPQQMQSHLEQAKRSDVNFQRIGLLDREATNTAHFPRLDELGQSNIGRNFGDRPFIPQLKRTLKPMLSEAIMGRFGTPKPIVAVLAPVIIRREYGGYVIGILSLEQIRDHLEKSTDQNATLYTLLDKSGNIIMTNRTDQTVMTPLVRGPGTLNRLDKTISQWVPTLPPNTSTIALWGKSFYVAETAIGDLAEWKLMLEQPVEPFQKTLYNQYTGKLTLLFLILLGTMALAEFLSRKIVVTLEQLRALTNELPVRLATDGQEIAWPESGVKEANHLINNFRKMADSLSEMFIKTRQINESLEQRVEERTDQLANVTHELSIILENAPVGISRIIDRKQVWINRKIEDLFQYSKAELEFQTTRKLYPSDEAYEKLGREAYPILAQGLVFETVQELIRKDGIHIRVRYIGKAIDPQDMSKGALWLLEDITERKRAEEEKRHLEERLQRAEKMEALGQLASGVAHDLNNILGVLSGYSELLLLEIPEGQRSRGHVEKILQSTEKGAAIIQDLLTLARRGVTASDVVDLNRIVSDFLKTPVFERLRDFNPRVTFRTECEPNLLNIKGSRVHLEKTLINLVSNAAESISGTGEVTIRTESRYLDKPLRGYDEIREGDYAVLIVSDTGMGIPVESREKIFEPFYTKKTMGRSGTGLGLAIVWGTVKDHNGYIDVQTEVGEGTTFTLYFPVTREELIAPQRKAPIEQYTGNGESVLVVDDVAEQRDIAAGLLTRLGYRVHAVSSGEEAVEYLQGNKADILVLDMIMPPGIDGLETYQRVLEIHPQQKAIIVSGFSETERVRQTQKLGAGAYVRKPYVMEKIGVAIRNELTR